MNEPARAYAVISVIEPVLQQPSENIPAFVTYLVGGTDPHGEFNIRRRYREFLLLRNKLAERFIGVYVPPIPSKRTAVLPPPPRTTPKNATWSRGASFCTTSAKK
jgi:hypothetical protein